MWILGTLFEQNRFSFDNLTHVVFWTKGKLVHKSPLKRLVCKSQFQNPWNLDDFFTTQIQIQIHNETQNRSNTLSHRLPGQGSLKVPTKYYIRIKMIQDYIN